MSLRGFHVLPPRLGTAHPTGQVPQPGDHAKSRNTFPTKRRPVCPRGAPARGRKLLNSAEGASVYDIAERFDVSVRPRSATSRAHRAGEPLYEDRSGGEGLAPDAQRPPRLDHVDHRPDDGLVPVAPGVRLPGRHGLQGGPRRGVHQGGVDAQAQRFSGGPELRPEDLRRQRGAAHLRRPHRPCERHHDRPAPRGASALVHGSAYGGRRGSCSIRTPCWSTRRASTWPATATTTRNCGVRAGWLPRRDLAQGRTLRVPEGLSSLEAG